MVSSYDSNGGSVVPWLFYGVLVVASSMNTTIDKKIRKQSLGKHRYHAEPPLDLSHLKVYDFSGHHDFSSDDVVTFV
jgi:hypothetical protein